MDKSIMGKGFHFYKTGLIFLVALSVLLTTGSYSLGSYLEYDLFNQAYKSYLSYQPEKAAEEFRAFLKEFPKSSAKDAAMFWLGKSLLQINSTEEAQRIFFELRQQFPESPFLSYIYKETGFSEKAFDSLPREEKPMSETQQEISKGTDESEEMSLEEKPLPVEKPEEPVKDYRQQEPVAEYKNEADIPDAGEAIKDEIPGFIPDYYPSKVEKPLYMVQVGVFTRKKTADYLKAKYLMKKYPVKIEETKSRGIQAYKVMIGEFPEKESAIDFAERIKQNEGLNTMIVQYSRGEAELVTGAAASTKMVRADTQSLVAEMEKKGREEKQTEVIEPVGKSDEEMQAEPKELREKTVEEMKADITKPEEETIEKEKKAEPTTREPEQRSIEETQAKLVETAPENKEIQAILTEPHDRSSEQILAGLQEPEEKKTEELQANLTEPERESARDEQLEPTEPKQKITEEVPEEQTKPQVPEENRLVLTEEQKDTSQLEKSKKEEISVPTELPIEAQNKKTASSQTEYSVQIGVFTNQNTVNYFLDKYIKEGYPVKVTKTITNDKTAYKVMVGEFSDRKEAEDFSEGVNKNEGVSTMIVEYEAADKKVDDILDVVLVTDFAEQKPVSEQKAKGSEEMQTKTEKPDAGLNETQEAVQSSIQQQDLQQIREDRGVDPDATNVLSDTKKKDADELQAMVHEPANTAIDMQHLQEKIKEQKEAQEEIEEILKETKAGQEQLNNKTQDVAKIIPDSIDKKQVIIQIYGKNYTLQDISEYMTSSKSFMKKSNLTEVLWRTGDELEDFSNEQLLYDKAEKLKINIDANTQKEMIEQYGLVDGEVDYLKRYLGICNFINMKIQELPGERVVESLISNYNEGDKKKKIALSTEIQTHARNSRPFEDIARSYPDQVSFAAVQYNKLEAWVKEKIGLLKDNEIAVIWSDSGYMILKPVTKRDLLKPFTYVHSEKRDAIRRDLDIWIAELKSENTVLNNPNQQ